LWQKARDRLGYLLDPDVAPPSRVSTSDGLIAAMVFFVVQAIVIAIGGSSGATVVVAFSIAGAFTYALMRYVYARSHTEGVPRFMGEGLRLSRGLLTGLGAGLAAAAVAVAYLLALRNSPLLEEAKQASSYADLGLWVLPLALVAAPVFEEFIFRGLIFGGLRRSFGSWPAALASAAIFACMHPPISILPVFALGLATAYAYDRSRGLLAPMIAHASYNACVIAAQALNS